MKELEKSKLLRFGPDTIELAHDSLAKIIYDRRSDKQREQDILRTHLRLAMNTFSKTIECLTEKQLIRLGDLKGLLPDDEAKFFEQSSVFRNDEKNEELHREQLRSKELESALDAAQQALEKNKRLIDQFYFHGDRLTLAYQKSTEKLSGKSSSGKYGFVNKEGITQIKYFYDKATKFEDDEYVRVEVGDRKYLLGSYGHEYPLAYSVQEVNASTIAIDLSKKGLASIPEEVLRLHTFNV